jgi:hypothetical protein
VTQMPTGSDTLRALMCERSLVAWRSAIPYGMLKLSNQLPSIVLPPGQRKDDGFPGGRP